MTISEFPLTKANRLRLGQAFRHVPRVDMSIDCVLEDQMGKAFVDNQNEPTAFKIQIGPFTYLAGDPNSTGGQAMIDALQAHTMIMSTGPGWLDALKTHHGDKVTAYPRYSFSADSLKLETLENLLAASPWREKIKQVDSKIAQDIWGKPGLADISDFESAEDFIARGIGCCLHLDREMIGVIYSSLVNSKGIEISLVVNEAHRRQGIATALSCALLIWCLRHNMHPNWDAANPASKDLALKLGYKSSGSYHELYLGE